MPKPARQYTIRNVPDHVDRVLRRRVKETGQSFNQVALEALSSGTGESAGPKRDLSGIAGSLSSKEAESMDAEIRHQRRVDPNLWK